MLNTDRREIDIVSWWSDDRCIVLKESGFILIILNLFGASSALVVRYDACSVAWWLTG